MFEVNYKVGKVRVYHRWNTKDDVFIVFMYLPR